MTEDELIEKYETNASEKDSLNTLLGKAYNIIHEKEAKLKEYIDNAYKAKEIGEELSYYQIKIRELNEDLVCDNKHIAELKHDHETTLETINELTEKLESLGYQYKWYLGSNVYGFPCPDWKWMKVEKDND